MIRLVLQFLRDQGLHATARTLQAEAGVENVNLLALCADTRQSFLGSVREGRWDRVMELVDGQDAALRRLVGDALVYRLYEVMLVDLLGRLELNLVRTLMQRLPFMLAWQREEAAAVIGASQGRSGAVPSRVGGFSRLQALLSQCLVDPTAAHSFYPAGSSVEQQKGQLASALEAAIPAVPSARLLCLLGDAIRWSCRPSASLQESVTAPPPASLRFDLLRGGLRLPDAGDDRQGKGSSSPARPVDRPVSTVYMSKSYPGGITQLAYSPDGTIVAVAKAGGRVELLNAASLAHRAGPWQITRGAHQDVTALAFATLNQAPILILGCTSGDVLILALPSGTLISKLDRLCPSGPVGLIRVAPQGDCFAIAGPGGGDIKVCAIPSGAVLRHFRGHEPFTTDLCFTSDGARLASVGSDGRLCVWDVGGAALIRALHPGSSGRLSHGSLVAIFPALADDQAVHAYLCCTAEGLLIRVNDETGAEVVLLDLFPERPPDALPDSHHRLVAACLSESQRFLYVGLASGTLMTVELVGDGGGPRAIGTSEQAMAGGPVTLLSHPHQSILVTLDAEGAIKFWRPSS